MATEQNIIVKFTSDTSGLQPAIEQMRILGKITDEDARKISEINAEQQKFNATVNATTNEFTDFSKTFKTLGNDIKSQVIVEASNQLKEFAQEATKGGTEVKSLKAQLREMKAQIASGSLGAKELKEVTKRAAELTDHLGDVQEKIKGLSSDTKNLDAVVTAFRGIAGGVAVASGAMALFGEQNKELEKGLMKVQGAMALLQGVQELATIATGNSTLKTYALAAAEALAGKSATIMGVEITAATAASTAGLSLLLLGVTYLIMEMDDAGESAEEFAKRMGDSLALQVKYTDLATALMSNARQRDLKQAENDYIRNERELKKSYQNRTITLQEYSKFLEIETKTLLEKRKSINEKYDKEEKDALDKKNKERKDKQAKIDLEIEKQRRLRLDNQSELARQQAEEENYIEASKQQDILDTKKEVKTG